MDGAIHEAAKPSKSRDLLTLIGYRGTGKTSVARRVAEQMQWQFVDADAMLEQIAGRTIAEIFAAEGENRFRDLESTVIQELTMRSSTVIASGGGVILRAENRAALERGYVAWLKAKPETVLQRIREDQASATQRPNLTEQGG